LSNIFSEWVSFINILLATNSWSWICII